MAPGHTRRARQERQRVGVPPRPEVCTTGTPRRTRSSSPRRRMRSVASAKASMDARTSASQLRRRPDLLCISSCAPLAEASIGTLSHSSPTAEATTTHRDAPRTALYARRTTSRFGSAAVARMLRACADGAAQQPYMCCPVAHGFGARWLATPPLPDEDSATAATLRVLGGSGSPATRMVSMQSWLRSAHTRMKRGEAWAIHRSAVGDLGRRSRNRTHIRRQVR